MTDSSMVEGGMTPEEILDELLMNGEIDTEARGPDASNVPGPEGSEGEDAAGSESTVPSPGDDVRMAESVALLKRLFIMNPKLSRVKPIRNAAMNKLFSGKMKPEEAFSRVQAIKSEKMNKTSEALGQLLFDGFTELDLVDKEKMEFLREPIMDSIYESLPLEKYYEIPAVARLICLCGLIFGAGWLTKNANLVYEWIRNGFSWSCSEEDSPPVKSP